MRQRFKLRNIALKFIQCCGDERGIALTEYLLVTGIVLPLAVYLFHPDNGFYKGARDQYERTKLMLVFPGP